MNAMKIVTSIRRSSLRSAMILSLIPLAAGVAQTGDRTNVRGVGMGRTVNAAARGVDAIGANPSLLALPDNRLIEIGLPTVGFFVRSQFISYDVYNQYFTGVENSSGTRVAKVLSDQDKRDLIALLPDEGETRGQLDIRSLAISFHHNVVGGIGFSVTDHVGLKNNLDKDFFAMPFFGLDSAGSRYDLSDNRVEGWWWREYALSYGREIPLKLPWAKRWYAGLGVKIVRGYGVFETVSYRGIVENSRVDQNQYVFRAQSDFLVRRSGIQEFASDSAESGGLFPDPAGKGTGFDVGLTAELSNGIRISAAVVNLGSVTWEKNLVETVGAGSITVANPFTVEGNDSLLSALRGSNRPGSSFTTALPTQLRVGAVMRSDEVSFLRWLPGRMTLALDVTKGFNTSLGNSTQPRFSLGTEYRLIPLLPLRTGFAWGGGDSFRWAAGFGLDLYFLSLDLATENMGVLTSLNNFSMFQFSAGLKIRI